MKVLPGTASRKALVVVLSVLAAAVSLPAQDPLRVEAEDGIVSVQAERVRLGDLLRALERASGIRSDVPMEFEDRTVSVWFSGLALNQAIRKIFEGQGIDYAWVEGHRIVVLAESEPVTVNPRAARTVFAPPGRRPVGQAVAAGAPLALGAANGNPENAAAPQNAGSGPEGAGTRPGQAPAGTRSIWPAALPSLAEASALSLPSGPPTLPGQAPAGTRSIWPAGMLPPNHPGARNVFGHTPPPEANAPAPEGQPPAFPGFSPPARSR